MKLFWKIILWFLGIYLLFNLLAAFIGLASSLILPAAIIYFFYRAISQNNKKLKNAAKKIRKTTGLLVYRRDWWKILPAVLLLAPLYWLNHMPESWLFYSIVFTLLLASGYFFLTSFRRWVYLEISDFGLVRVDHKYFFRHKIIYDWSRVYYTELSTVGLNYQLYIATLDGSFTISQKDLKDIAIPELKQLIDSYIKAGGTPTAGTADEPDLATAANKFDKFASSILDGSNLLLDKAKKNLDNYRSRSKRASDGSTADLTPIVIFKGAKKTRRRFAELTAFGLEFVEPQKIAKKEQKILRIAWENISDIKVDDLKDPSQLELDLKLAEGYELSLLIGDRDSNTKYTSLLPSKNLYLRAQTLKAHSQHTSMTV